MRLWLRSASCPKHSRGPNTPAGCSTGSISSAAPWTAGRADLADEIEQCLVGRDIIDGRWSFELVEAYDDQYWQVFRDVEREARARAAVPDRHVFEAEMKVAEQRPR